MAARVYPSLPPGRLYFLDWLRIAAFGLLVLYHVGMYYVSWDWHVKSPFASPALEPLMLLTSPWRLALLFLISGAASSLMLAKQQSRSPGQPTGNFLRQRSWRLLLPLVFGMFVIVPPQAYFEAMHKFAYRGSYLEFMGLYLRGFDGFCRGAQCLTLPTWNHLWFVAYLWLYTLLLWALNRFAPRALDCAGAWLSRSLTPALLLVVPVLWLALSRLWLLDRFPSTHALVNDFYNHVLFGSVFAAGAVCARAGAVWLRMSALRWHALPVALLGWALLALYFSHFQGTEPPAALRQAMRVPYAAVQWCAIVAVLGFGFRHWNADHRWRRYAVEAVFPVYILHQTLIVLLTQALLPLHWPPAVEGPLLVLATFALSLMGFEMLRRVPLLRPFFGLAPARAEKHPQFVPSLTDSEALPTHAPERPPKLGS